MSAPNWKRCRACGVRLNFEPLVLEAIDAGELPQLCVRCRDKQKAKQSVW